MACHSGRGALFDLIQHFNFLLKIMCALINRNFDVFHIVEICVDWVLSLWFFHAWKCWLADFGWSIVNGAEILDGIIVTLFIRNLNSIKDLDLSFQFINPISISYRFDQIKSRLLLFLFNRRFFQVFVVDWWSYLKWWCVIFESEDLCKLVYYSILLTSYWLT